MNDWVDNDEAGDLRCHGAHYDVNVMVNYTFTLELSAACLDVILKYFPTNSYYEFWGRESVNLLYLISCEYMFLDVYDKPPFSTKNVIYSVQLYPVIYNIYELSRYDLFLLKKNL